MNSARSTLTISGTGSALPARVYTNSDFPKEIEVDADWIFQRTGIRERRIASPSETSGSLGVLAAQRALQAAKLSSSELDLIICATMTPDFLTPATACLIHAGLNVDRPIMAFDINSACSGFLYGINIAAQFLNTGVYRNILIVGADTMSRICNFQDHNVAILFGDGAGATIVSADPSGQKGILASRMYADGKLGYWIRLNCVRTKPPASTPDIPVPVDEFDYLTMQGSEVFRFAVNRIVSLTHETLGDVGLTLDDIDVIIPHQVNIRILDAAFKALGISHEKAVINLDRIGNTSGASVPIALDEAIRNERVEPGQTVLFLAFGGGMSWSSMVIRM